ncbi:uncharacterized protein LOC143578211 [Bidens hawaiensis]|uniref:uncharacterized protein LOC143578211 n=1 Tax=Bidens hawaiensis TaxID=980011 RepID=UPI00404B74DF
MYSNFTKCHAIPTAIRRLSTSTSSIGLLLGVASFNHQQKLKNSEIYGKTKSFSTSYSRKAGEGSESVKALPWLGRSKDSMKEPEPGRFTKDGREKVRRKDFKPKVRGDKLTPRKVSRSSWEESAERFVGNGVEGKERGGDYREKSKVSEDELSSRKVNRSSWEESVGRFVKNGVEGKERGRRFDGRSDYRERSKVSEDELSSRKVRPSSWNGGGYRERRDVSEDESDIESEETDNPKWYKVQDRFDRFDRIAGVERNDRFNRQDNWGKKVWKEASESSVPKMIGECVYGVGPVLAALSANRREFYVLYVQEGIDLSGNNKKKKDKKAFEKVLKFADKLGLTKKEVSKHDLNMIADNRPHQGLVLDASPLEMVNIKELDPVVENEGTGLWLALDEVMDPQNLGAIIRSAYFFGAAGVVLCAKNSAPLSGVVSKASAGSLELTELRSCKNMMQFLASSAENGWRVLGGSVSSRAMAIKEVTTDEPTILVLGSEGTGLRPLVERSCTQLVKIPGNMPVHLSAGLEDVETKSFVAVESLNVSVAAGVLLHHLAGSKTAVNVE